MAAAVDNYNWMVDGLIELSHTPVTEESSDAYWREFQLYYGQRSAGDLLYCAFYPRCTTLYASIAFRWPQSFPYQRAVYTHLMSNNNNNNEHISSINCATTDLQRFDETIRSKPESGDSFNFSNTWHIRDPYQYIGRLSYYINNIMCALFDETHLHTLQRSISDRQMITN